MAFDFKKHIPKQFKKIKVPDNFNWEVHSLHAYADLKAAVAKGTKTLADLQQFELDHRETADQREHRWRREHILEELANDGARDYREFKDNPKSFMRKMMDMGRGISRWWWKQPKKSAGKGRMIQNQITGGWQQEYKPSKSMNMKDWLNAANHGNVMLHMNPKRKPLNRLPTDKEKDISKEAKKERKRQEWNAILEATDNFGRGWTQPKWGALNKGAPGRGGGRPKPKTYTIKG
jgi:hypothetical protein